MSTFFILFFSLNFFVHTQAAFKDFIIEEAQDLERFDDDVRDISYDVAKENEVFDIESLRILLENGIIDANTLMQILQAQSKNLRVQIMSEDGQQVTGWEDENTADECSDVDLYDSEPSTWSNLIF